jgi:hypothetical protein
MKRLLVLWDPENPMAQVGPVVQALGERMEVKELTLADISHRTLPNGAFDIRPLAERWKADGLLWIEGGPFPGDLEKLPIRKGAWLLNTHHEPTLASFASPLFDCRLGAELALSADESFRWIPLASGTGSPPAPPRGISVLLDDPKPPYHARMERGLREAAQGLPPPPVPVVFSLGQGGSVHPHFFEALRSGAAVLADSQADLRGLVHAGDHAEVLPDGAAVHEFLKELIGDRKRLLRLGERGPEIVRHLHTPDLRARQILESLSPTHTVLGGKDWVPAVSILVTCHRYRKRLAVCLESLARQELPEGTLEIVVADPESPDGLRDHLESFARKYSHLRVIHLPLDVRYRRNRGVGINRAFDASLGGIIISIDGDIVFPPHLVRRLMEEVEKSPGMVFGVGRVFLPRETTEEVLSGAIDPFVGFHELLYSPGDGEEQRHVGVLGYCQAVRRTAFSKARYPEEFDMVNQSDIVFVERLAQWAGVRPKFLDEEAVLHLWHPRNWTGTSDFL